MNIDEAKTKFAAVLEAKTSTLVVEIKRMIIDRPFSLDSGVTKDLVNGIHFEYEWDSFIPIACPLNTITGYCGAGKRLALFADVESKLFHEDIEEDIVESALPDEQESIAELFYFLKIEMYCEWFAAAWKLARNVDPAIHGFLSVHDSIWRTDLDTGEEFREDSGRIKFF